mgnify:CR=1 FL=1
MTKLLQPLRQHKGAVGFVPTMGALHPGHISLVDKAREQCPVLVSSIFVNPTQFNDPGDFEKYPVTIEKDIDMLEAAGCDILFLPSVKEIYPGGLTTTESYALGYLETVLEGKYRPGHFQGVCRVVHRLLDMIQPDIIFLGQKDYQQCMVIQKMIALKGLNAAVAICPTCRESNGLAMSSRNMRLDDAGKIAAAQLYQTLMYIRAALQSGHADIGLIKEKAAQQLMQGGLKPDYVEIADAQTLVLLQEAVNGATVVALVAAFLGDVRLIDNLVIEILPA